VSKEHEMVGWMLEREAMRRRKEELGGVFPYSKDPVMAYTRFTNVRREDDKVTRWIKENWRTPYANHPNLPVAMVLARMVNYIPSLYEINFPVVWIPKDIIQKMKAIAGRGDKLWSSAYLITTCGKRMGKEEYVVDHVCTAVIPLQERILAARTCEEAFNLLRSVDGLGSFLAAQVVADLKNVPTLPLAHADDWYTWSAPGPGSLKGLSAFWERNVTPASYQFYIERAWERVRPLLPSDLQNISNQDFQNCFCEYSKFVRIKSGGQARNRYGV